MWVGRILPPVPNELSLPQTRTHAPVKTEMGQGQGRELFLRVAERSQESLGLAPFSGASSYVNMVMSFNITTPPFPLLSNVDHKA